jgi:Tfp pilus assembly protein PilV
MNLSRNEGHMLVESIVAITLVLVGLTGIITLLLRSTVANRDAYNRLTASYLAAEGIEVIKYLIDKNIADNELSGGVPWNKDISNSNGDPINFDTINFDSSGCPSISINYDSGVSAFVCTAGDAMQFSRSVEVLNNANSILVESTVTWTERNSPSSLTVVDEFFNWRR